MPIRRTYRWRHHRFQIWTAKTNPSISIIFISYCARISLLFDKISFVKEISISIFVIMCQVSLNLVYIPSLFENANPSGIFPFAPSAWSLSFEVGISFAYGPFLYRASKWSLNIIILLAITIVIVLAAKFGSLDMGWGRDTITGGVARTVASFVFGVTIYHQRSYLTLRFLTGPASTVVAVATLICIVWLLMTVPRSQYVIQILVVYFIFPFF